MDPLQNNMFEQQKDLISLDSLCEMLSISAATGRNWLRLGKLTAQVQLDKAPYFTPDYVKQLRTELEDKENTRLKSRRNKKYVSGNDMYHAYVSEHSLARVSVQQVVSMISSSGIIISDLLNKTLVAECAVQLLLHHTIFPFTGNCLEGYLRGWIALSGSEFLVEPLLDQREASLELIREYPKLFEVIYQYEEGEDTLGLLYISLKNIGTRKARGLYFTPTKVVQKMCSKLFEKNQIPDGRKPEEMQILDPCCGTGNFLLQLPAEIPFDHIYGNDTDVMSIRIARINMSLKFGIKEEQKLLQHLTIENYLFPRTAPELLLDGEQLTVSENSSGRSVRDRSYDMILGNPPWGYVFSDEEKNALRDMFQSPEGSNIESYDVFMEQDIKDLRPGGALSYVLPEALLNVRSHTRIRRILCDTCDFQYLEYLGNAFDKVQCPCIILQVQKVVDLPQEQGLRSFGGGTAGMEVQDQKRRFFIQKDRNLSPESFGFLADDNGLIALREKNIALRLLNDRRAHQSRTAIQTVSVGTPLLLIGLIALGVMIIRRKKYIL